MKVHTVVLCFFIYLSIFAQLLPAYTNSIGTLSGGGGWVTNSLHKSTGFVGTFASARLNKADSHWSRAGMLVSFLLHPGLDFDGDGIPDEDDSDDDSDLLTDFDELTGIAFIPVTATDPFNSDSDNDGAGDGDEAIAGTNPTNALSLFKITDIQKDGNSIVIKWQGREGMSYDLAVDDALDDISDFIVITNIVATGGTGDWFETEVSATNIPSSLKLFYRVNIHK